MNKALILFFYFTPQYLSHIRKETILQKHMKSNYSKTQIIIRFNKNVPEKSKLQVIEESSVLLMVNGEEWLTLRCSPVDLKELGLGFLFNQGIIELLDEIEEIKICKDGGLDIWLTHPAKKPRFFERASGCAGGTSFQVEEERIKEVDARSIFNSSEIYSLLEVFLSAQEIRKKVRGLHTSALSDGKSINSLFSDIGRHNTLDKLAGKWLLTDTVHPLKICFCTGRISSEMLFKCARMRLEMIISFSTPTSQAIKDAEKLGITLIGYARVNQFNIYSHTERIRAA